MNRLIFGILVAVSWVIGVMLHEFGHKFFCDLTMVKVLHVSYFNTKSDIRADGFVIHEKPKHLYQAFFITFGPMFSVGLVILAYSFIASKMSFGFELFYGVVAGLVISLFPSSVDLGNLRHHLEKSKLNTLVKFAGINLCRLMLIFTSLYVKAIFAVILVIFFASVFS